MVHFDVGIGVEAWGQQASLLSIILRPWSIRQRVQKRTSTCTPYQALFRCSNNNGAAYMLHIERSLQTGSFANVCKTANSVRLQQAQHEQIATEGLIPCTSECFLVALAITSLSV